MELVQPALRILNQLYGNITITGLIAPPEIELADVRKIVPADLKNLDYDLILVTGADNVVLQTNAQSNFVKVLKEAESLGIDTEKIVPDKVVCVPFFTPEKYNQLRRSQLSIFSLHCFAGLLYHRLGLPFLSPTINMFATEQDFLKFLKDPMNILRQQLVYQRLEYDEAMDVHFPVFKIGEVEWHMNHYKEADEAFKKWYARSFRVNWFNLLVTMYTEKPEVLEEFDKLPYAKKICFVPFKSKLDSAYSIDTSKYPKGTELWLIVNNIARGYTFECDIWDMLLYGKKTPIIFK